MDAAALASLPPSVPASDQLVTRLQDLRHQIADGVGEQPDPTSAGPAGPETTIAADAHAVQVRTNSKNTRASQVALTLAEPSAVNDGNSVFYLGNTFASSSGDKGASWAAVALPAGPADAPFACCDQDVVRAHSRSRIISTLLYVNSALTNGVVRFFVRSGPQSPASCAYDIRVGARGTIALPDYPHLGLSNNFVYLGTNNLVNDRGTGAQVRRFNLAQMSACQTVGSNTFTWTGSVGQRILTPVEGATTVMYFGANESGTSFRAFAWPENSTSVSTVLRNVATTNFSKPDCRGGVGNFDFAEVTLAGFQVRGSTGGGRTTFWWPGAADANHPQSYLHGVSLGTSDLAVIEQPVVWSGTSCIGFPAVASNASGDIGMAAAIGGRSGGGGSAAQGAVLVDDASAPGTSFPTALITASGTHNRPDSRFGDYFTVRTNARCPANWVAANFALLNGNSSPANVNARYVEFQSSLRPGC